MVNFCRVFGAARSVRVRRSSESMDVRRRRFLSKINGRCRSQRDCVSDRRVVPPDVRKKQQRLAETAKNQRRRSRFVFVFRRKSTSYEHGKEGDAGITRRNDDVVSEKSRRKSRLSRKHDHKRSDFRGSRRYATELEHKRKLHVFDESHQLL